MKRAILIFSSFFAVLCSISLGTLGQDIPQPGIIRYDPGVAEFRPAFPGEVVEVFGNNFAMGESYTGYNNVHAEVIFVDANAEEIALQTRVESVDLLYFLVPVEAPCGAQKFYIKNGQDIPQNDSAPTPTRAIFVDCDESNVGPQGNRPEIDDVSPELIRAGDELSLRGTGFTFSSVIHFNDQIITEVEWISQSEVRFNVPTGASCGASHSIRLENRVLHYPSRNSNFPSNSDPIFISVLCGTSSRSTERTVDDVDLNKDCLISNDEFFVAVDAWVEGVILDQLFFDSIDAWVGEINLCEQLTPLGAASIRSAHIDVNALLVRNAIYFDVQDKTQQIQIEVFDIMGTPIYSGFSAGGGVLWRFQNFNEQNVANGVYFYRATAQNSLGQVLRSPWRKFVLMR